MRAVQRQVRGAGMGEDMLKRLKDAVVDTRTVPGHRDLAIARWIDDALIQWDENGLFVTDSDDDPVLVKPGWLLVKWPDGVVTVCSTRTALRLFEDYEATP